MSSTAVHHVLMTRFNIRTAGVGYSPRQSPDWLESRFGLFARYCAPSIAAQTEAEFDWLIYCDEGTSLETVERLCAFDPRIRIALFANKVDPEEERVGPSPEVLAHPRVSPQPGKVLSTLSIAPHVRPGSDVVITTRLDNDDGLSRHALHRVRGRVQEFLESGHPRWLYNPTLGFKLDQRTGQLYPVAKHNSAFLSLFERVADVDRPIGVCSGNHSRMHEQYPTYQDEGARIWLMVIHENNVLNGIGARDRAVPMANLGGDFVIDLAVAAR